MTDAQQKAAAKQFVKDWTGHGDEKQETQRFWMALLQKVYGVAESDNAIEFEVRVKLDHTSFIVGYIKDTHVQIEQKGMDVDLKKGYKQSDGSMLTPFQQARRYAGYLPHNMNPLWIVVCNFKEFHIHDMNRPNDTPEVIKLEELETEYSRLQFLVDTGNERIQKEMQISLQAGDLVGKLYDALLKQYNSPASDVELKSLNMLCLRQHFSLCGQFWQLSQRYHILVTGVPFCTSVDTFLQYSFLPSAQMKQSSSLSYFMFSIRPIWDLYFFVFCAS